MASSPDKCKVKGCASLVYATGLCRQCYSKQWRLAKYGPPKHKRRVTPRPPETTTSIELRTLKEAYRNAVGIDARIRIRRQIDRIESASPPQPG